MRKAIGTQGRRKERKRKWKGGSERAFLNCMMGC
jgi:hypothetical protein